MGHLSASSFLPYLLFWHVPLLPILNLCVRRFRLPASDGQAYKGGPPSGVFLQLTGDDARDLPVPGRSYTFGVVQAAQARGDFEVLVERRRRALRVHLGVDIEAGVDTVGRAMNEALKASV